MPELEKLVKGDFPPEGWVSASDIANKLGVSSRTIKTKMDRLERENRIETAMYKGKNFKPTKHYKVSS